VRLIERDRARIDEHITAGRAANEHTTADDHHFGRMVPLFRAERLGPWPAQRQSTTRNNPPSNSNLTRDCISLPPCASARIWKRSRMAQATIQPNQSLFDSEATVTSVLEQSS
jgi:hypothetical protein